MSLAMMYAKVTKDFPLLTLQKQYFSFKRVQAKAFHTKVKYLPPFDACGDSWMLLSFEENYLLCILSLSPLYLYKESMRNNENTHQLFSKKNETFSLILLNTLINFPPLNFNFLYYFSLTSFPKEFLCYFILFQFQLRGPEQRYKGNQKMRLFVHFELVFLLCSIYLSTQKRMIKSISIKSFNIFLFSFNAKCLVSEPRL